MYYKDIIQETETQRSNQWYRARLGKVTGSRVACLMTKGRSKKWTDTAEKYLCEIWGEKTLDRSIMTDDDILGEYLNRTQKETKAMQWGSNNEANAISVFQQIIKLDKEYADTFGGLSYQDVGSCKHPAIEGFNSSPDGLLIYPDGYVSAAMEIKCPEPKMHAFYTAAIKCGNDLKKYKPEYYWQCVSHMAVSGAPACFFIWYDPNFAKACRYILIPRDDDEIAKLEERVTEAINDINNNLQDVF